MPSPRRRVGPVYLLNPQAGSPSQCALCGSDTLPCRHNLPTRDQGFPWNIHVVGNLAIEGNYFFSEYDSYGRCGRYPKP